MSAEPLPDGAEARWVAGIPLSPFRRAVLAHLATMPDTPPGLLQRMDGQGWWFLGPARLYPVLYALERLRLVGSEWKDRPNEPYEPGTPRRRIYKATRLGILWLNGHAASGRPPNRDEWRVLSTLGDLGGLGTGIGLVDFLEDDIPPRRLVKAFQQLETGGYITIDWRAAGDNVTNYRRWRYSLTAAGRQLLAERRANHGG